MQILFKIVILQKFALIAGKHQWWSLFLIKLQDWIISNPYCNSLVCLVLILEIISKAMWNCISDYLFSWLACKSLLNRFSVLIIYTMSPSNLFSAYSCFPRFSWSRYFRIRVLKGPGFSVSRFFWVRVQGPGPESGSRSNDQYFSLKLREPFYNFFQNVWGPFSNNSSGKISKTDVFQGQILLIKKRWKSLIWLYEYRSLNLQRSQAWSF